MNGCCSEVKTIGAVEVSPFGGFRHRSVFGPAVRVKYSMHCGSENDGGRFNAVNDEPSGDMVAIEYLYNLDGTDNMKRETGEPRRKGRFNPNQ